MTRDLKEIDSRDDLLDEKERLKQSIKARKAGISNSFSAMRAELNPFRAFSGSSDGGKSIAGSLLSSAGSSPLVSMGVSSAANFLLKRVFLKNAGFLPRLILPLVVKKASDFIVAPTLNKKLVGGMRTAAEKIRETDIEEVLPDAKELVPAKALSAVAKTSDKIADKLYDTAEKIRPDEKPQVRYSSSLLKKTPDRRIAKKLRRLADKIRG